MIYLIYHCIFLLLTKITFKQVCVLPFPVPRLFGKYKMQKRLNTVICVQKKFYKIFSYMAKMVGIRPIN